MSCKTHQRLINDTLLPFYDQIVNDNQQVVNLTGYSVKFFLRDLAGTVVLAPTAGVIVDADDGQVSFDFPAGAVDEAGSFLGYWQVINGSEVSTYPPEGIAVTIVDPGADNTPADQSVLTAEEIADLARAPRRTRTAEGTVEERSIADLIKADQHLAAKAADTVPWGMRIAKTKPPSTLS